MIIWTSSIESDAKIEIPHMGIRSWRNQIAISWCKIVFIRQIKYKEFDWRTIQSNSIAFKRLWKWEESHFWYDGPHCAWSFGFMHIYWARDNCKKCYYEAHDED